MRRYFFSNISAELTFSICRKITAGRDLPRFHRFVIFQLVKDSAAEVCRTCARGPTAFKTRQPVCLVRGPRPCSQAEPFQTARREVIERKPEEPERRFHFVTRVAVGAEMRVSDAAICVPQRHPD